jgi:hypothetical protein
VTQSGAGNVQPVLRRRRTASHRRNRLIRQVLVTLVLTFFGAGFSAVALRHFSPSLFVSPNSRTPGRQDAEASRDRLAGINEETFGFRVDRPVYPYSVVPGGIADARELKWIAEHDPVVAAHYAGFDYNHARVVRLVLARTVYVSYRIGNHVYWTRHRIKLQKGEKIITDGKMTARSKCGNRVEEVPQQAMSSAEPPVAKFEQPLAREGTAMQSPSVPFQSALLNRPTAPGEGPMPPLSLYSPFSGGDWVPIDPPPLPLPSAGVCSPGTKKGKGGSVGEVGGKGKKKGGACGPPETVPEPAPWLLVFSGLALMLWQARRRVVAARAAR